MKNVRSYWKYLFCFGFGSLLLSLLGSFSGEYNVFQADRNRIFTYAMLYFLFRDRLPAELIFSRVKDTKAYWRYLWKSYWSEICPLVTALSLVLVMPALILPKPIYVWGIPSFFVFIQMNAMVIYFYENITELSKKQQAYKLSLWIVIVTLAALFPRFGFNFWSYICFVPGLDAWSHLFYAPFVYLLLYLSGYVALSALLKGQFPAKRYMLILRERFNSPKYWLALSVYLIYFCQTAWQYFHTKTTFSLKHLFSYVFYNPGFRLEDSLDVFKIFTYLLFLLLVFWEVFVSAIEVHSYHSLISYRYARSSRLLYWANRSAVRIAFLATWRFLFIFSIVQVVFLGFGKIDTKTYLSELPLLFVYLLKITALGVFIYLWLVFWQLRAKEQLAYISAILLFIFMLILQNLLPGFTGLGFAMTIREDMVFLLSIPFIWCTLNLLLYRQIRNGDLAS